MGKCLNSSHWAIFIYLSWASARTVLTPAKYLSHLLKHCCKLTCQMDPKLYVKNRFAAKKVPLSPCTGGSLVKISFPLLQV
ncbi:hypothetical protein O6H91_20G031900 [Diphasiastrum complanatum]|uniref:Uncharacterized protein n=1 Tax=Diphasiastrum complanatum TaxID=34168 RepID=A0ACC2AQ66_DIPCM|nr:hypothetical protein O6H91_20G031900 [Diphasiastrum complanatum]